MNIKIFGGSGFCWQTLTKKLCFPGTSCYCSWYEETRIREVNVYRADSGEGSWVNPVKFVPAILQITRMCIIISMRVILLSYRCNCQFRSCWADRADAIKVNVAALQMLSRPLLKTVLQNLSIPQQESIFPHLRRSPLMRVTCRTDFIYGMSKYWAERVMSHYESKSYCYFSSPWSCRRFR